jgi:hypothetical protein
VFASDAGGSVAQPSHYDFAAEAGLTLSQLMYEDIPKVPIARQYEKEKSLVPPEIERIYQHKCENCISGTCMPQRARKNFSL